MGRTLSRRDDPGPVANSPPSDETILYQAAVEHRRVTLSVLCGTGSLSLEALAERVANEMGAGSTSSPDRLAGSLHHNHLQHLREAGLVASDEATGVALHSNVDDGRVRTLIEAGAGAWDALDAMLSDERRERVVAILDSRDAPLLIDELAAAVAAYEGGTHGGPREAVASTRVSLHHVDLPKLDAAGVVSYDHEAGRVELLDVPDAYRDIAEGRILSA